VEDIDGQIREIKVVGMVVDSTFTFMKMNDYWTQWDMNINSTHSPTTDLFPESL
jgi:hypothetical protein